MFLNLKTAKALGITVCRQNISDDLRLSLREYLAHRV